MRLLSLPGCPARTPPTRSAWRSPMPMPRVASRRSRAPRARAAHPRAVQARPQLLSRRLPPRSAGGPPAVANGVTRGVAGRPVQARGPNRPATIAPHVCAVRGGRQVPRRPRDDGGRELGADRARVGQARQGEGGERAAEVRAARARRADRIGECARERDRPRPRVGIRARQRVRLCRPGARLLRAEAGARSRLPRCSACSRRRTTSAGSARAIQEGARGDRQGRAARHRAQEAAGRTDRRLGRRPGRRRLPGAGARAALPDPLQAGQQRARIQGGRRGGEALAARAARPAEGRRRDRLAYQFHWRRFLFEHFPKGTGFRRCRRPRSRRRCRRRRSRPSRSTIRRPPRSTMRCRCRASAAARSRSASTSPRRASRSRPTGRSTRSRASACRPSTCRATSHDAARRRRRRPTR